MLKEQNSTQTSDNKAENKNIANNAKTDENQVVCDKCGAVMVLKNGRYGEFYACPNYPECKNIVPYKKAKKSE